MPVVIRGITAKAIADKGDASYITCLITEEEKKIIEPTVMKLGLPMPNTVTDVWKTRRGRHKNVRIWSLVDLGTCRVQDVLVTDAYYNLISNFEVIKYSDDFEFQPENQKKQGFSGVITEKTPVKDTLGELRDLF